MPIFYPNLSTPSPIFWPTATTHSIYIHPYDLTFEACIVLGGRHTFLNNLFDFLDGVRYMSWLEIDSGGGMAVIEHDIYLLSWCL